MKNNLLFLKGAFTLLTLTFSMFAAIAQTSLVGSIKNEKGEPIIGATVTLRGSGIGAISDPDGMYHFRTSATGDVQIMVSALSYKTVTQSVTLSAGEQKVDFTLVEDAMGLDQVVVTGTSSTRTQKEVTGSLTQLSAKQIQAISPNSLADILRLVPGVHAEGGGGEVAANIFVRGMPAGGQYKYTPIEEDGMPVQSTAYLTSSAQDVYFRGDLGIANMEFARGGSSTMFGLGSPLGVINYISKKGGDNETTLKLSTGQFNLYRLDFNTGAVLNSNWQYNLSGVARYDEGPQVTGANSRGYQFKGNVTRHIDNGYMRFYFRTIDDNAQFYLPVPHLKNTTDVATGNDGNPVNAIYSTEMGNFALVNTAGTTVGRLGDGVTAKGSSAMFEFAKQFGSWELKSKTRVSSYQHRFDFWAPGKTFEANAYAASKSSIYKSHEYKYAQNGQAMALSNGANGGKTYVTENAITLRNRPMSDYSTDLRLTKRIQSGRTQHNLTIGTFGAITRQLQDEIATGVLVELKDQPRLVDLVVTDTAGKKINITKGGFRQNVAGRTYNTFEAQRMAIYAGDEIVMGKLRIDLGARYEVHQGIITVSKTAAATNAAATNSADASYRNLTGEVVTRKVNFDDFGFVTGLNYALSSSTNLYGSFTKGFYFPELRTFSNINVDGNGAYIQQAPAKNEALYQGEIGAKYGAGNLSGNIALFYNNIQNRLQNDLVLGSDNVIREITTPVGSVTSYGTEISAAYRIVEGLTIDANATLQQHQYDDFKKTTSGTDGKLGTADDVVVDYAGNWTLRQPKLLINGGISFERKQWDIGLMINHEGKRYADDQNNVELPAYSILNARIGKAFRAGDKEQIKIGLNVYNALNSRGLTEGDPRVADTSVATNDPFYNARPILPRRITVFVMFKF